MSKKLILYSDNPSPPVRAVLLTIYALELDVEYRHIDISKDGQFNEEYVKKNPQHTIPLLELEDGRYIGDSHAITAYLVGAYGKNDSLYPKDLYLRAQIDRFLHFESGLLFSELKKMTRYLLANKPNNCIPKHYIEHFETNFEILNTFLENRTYITGEQLTIADFSLLSIVSTLDEMLTLNVEKFPNLAKWLYDLKQLPYYEKANRRGIEDVQNYMKMVIGHSE